MVRRVAKCRGTCWWTADGRGGRFPVRAVLLAWIWGLVVASVAGAYEGGAAPVVDNRAPADVAELKAMERQIQATLAKVTPSVVGVSGGSGVVVSADGYVLTVAHVAGRAGRQVSITLPDGRKTKATTLGNDFGVDAGLLKISDEGPWPHVEMGASADLKPGQWCLAMGYPVTFDRGKAAVVRIGRVLRHGPTMVITDAAIMGGDSGGPLFDLDGRVIAVGSRCDQGLTTNIYVPVDCYHDHWERLADGEDFNSRAPVVAFLGVGPDEDTDDPRVGHVVPGSGAERAGIRLGDVILKVDGKEIQRFADLSTLIRKRKPGDKVEIELERDEKTVKVRATLGKQGG